tara:strand:+ start:684 stop:1337 length:654 start_codon:yes stop_codon:yes gene_type:complete
MPSIKIKPALHQIYWDFTHSGRKLEDVDHYIDAVRLTQRFASTNGFQHMMWNYETLTALVQNHYPEYIQLWTDFRYDIQRCDFGRLLCIHKYGGIYIDCDVSPTADLKPFLKKDWLLFKKYPDSGQPYNAVVCGKVGNKKFKQIMEHCKVSTYDKQSNSIYIKWKGRLVFQTTGERMLKRCVTKLQHSKLPVLTDYFQDYNTGHNRPSLWYTDIMKR